MARRAEYDQTPEEKAREVIRYNDTLQEEQKRRDTVNSRTLHRNQALNAGIPKSMLPDPSQIKNMDDATWNGYQQRMARMGFHGVDAQGRLLPAPQQSPLVLPSRVQARGMLTSVNPLTTTGPLEAGARRQPTSTATVAPVSPPLDQFSTTPADARAIAQRYGGEDQAGPKRQHTYIDASGKELGPMYDEKGNVNPMPKGATGLRGGDPQSTQVPSTPARTPYALDRLTTLPTEPFKGVDLATGSTPQFNTQLSNRAPVFPVEPKPPIALGIVQSAGSVARTALDTLASIPPKAARFAGGALREAVIQPTKDIVSGVTGAANQFLTGFNPAGASNASAAQFETPTKENPVTVTPTTPPANIDQSENSLTRFGLSEDELSRRKQFAGF